jgi:hypothetical protein
MEMKRIVLLGLIVALCIIATPVVASYSCDPICEVNPDGSDKCCFGWGTPTSTNLVTPDEWNDNPTCMDLGFDAGTKFDPPNPVASGDFVWDFDPADPYVTWSSSFPIDAVIMKGGTVGANVYYYSPPSNGDSGLATPINPSGKPAGLSHIDFCYDNACDCNDESVCTADTCDQAGGCVFTPITCDDGNECTDDTCDPTNGCINTNSLPGTECSIGVCDGNGNCGVPNPVPEFPSLALPVAFIIGIIGMVYVIKTRGN